jgi:hypothetical protein
LDSLIKETGCVVAVEEDQATFFRVVSLAPSRMLTSLLNAETLKSQVDTKRKMQKKELFFRGFCRPIKRTEESDISNLKKGKKLASTGRREHKTKF